jgi:NCK-associated protein 1
MALAEWCFAINYCNSIPVWEYTFYPREFLYQKLENLFNKMLVQKCYIDVTEKNEKSRMYLKPSEMLSNIESYMKVLMSIENHVQIDITKAFNNVLTQHTQLTDSNGYPTLTRHYCDLYIEKILKNIDRTHVIYSPSQKSFVCTSKEQASDPSSPENYINYIELLALTEIIGVVGTKYMVEQVNALIFENIIKIKAIVSQNKEILQSLRINFDRPDMMKDLYKRLENIDLALVSLLNIGIYLAFKNLLMEVLNETLERRLPYLVLSADDFSRNYGDNKFELIVNEMSASCGFNTPIDSGLYQIIKAPSLKQNPDEEYTISCLMMVLLAVSISRLTRYDSSQYKPDLQAHGNNAHCIANAINTLAGCLFYDMGADVQRNIENRLTEFLALASSALLKLTQDTNDTNGSSSNQNSAISQKEQTNRDSVYIILDQIVQSSPFLTFDLLESCFPYALLRTSYRQILKRNSNSSSNGFSNTSHFLIND